MRCHISVIEVCCVSSHAGQNVHVSLGCFLVGASVRFSSVVHDELMVSRVANKGGRVTSPLIIMCTEEIRGIPL